MDNAAVYACDLHTHTNRSDGFDSYETLIDNAAKRGLKVLAITDHDVVPKSRIDVEGSAVSVAEYGALKGVRVIPGIEFSCNTEVEDVHILGLCCDFAHPGFHAQEEMTKQSKIAGYGALCERLTACGMPISLEEVVKAHEAVTRIADIQKKHIFELMAKKGYAGDWGEAKRVVQGDPRFQVKRAKPAAEDVIRLIKASGGTAVLAHPYLIEEPVRWKGGALSRAEYIDILIEAGLDGIEGAYTYDKTTYGGAKSAEEIEREIRAAYSNRVAFISGGSDYHNDAAKGVRPEKCRNLGEKGIRMEDFLKSPLGKALRL